MILDLTIENLLESGLNIQDATALFNTTGNYNLQCNSGNFWVSKLENKFYTGIDFYRITYFNNGSLSFPIKCVDLVPEYFDLALDEFLENQKAILGILYNETDQFNKFISNEIESSQISIENYKALIKKVGSWRLNNKENDIQIRESYINYLKGKQHNTPALNSDTAPKKTKDYKKHIWFTTGIKLATGEAYDLYNKYKFDKGHFTKICLELGFKETDRPYISDTINENTGDKNTFANPDKIKKLHQYLTENNLNIGAVFLSKYNQIELE